MSRLSPGRRSNPRRANGARRDAIRRRVLREESVCWLCGQPVDVTLPHGRPDSPELDEVVPVSKGGDPLNRSNIRLAHRLCPATSDEGTKTLATGKWNGCGHSRPVAAGGEGDPGPAYPPTPPQARLRHSASFTHSRFSTEQRPLFPGRNIIDLT